MSSKDSNIEVVVKAVDEFSKAMKDFQAYLKQTSDNSATTEKSVKSLGDRLSGFGNIMTGFLRQAGVDIFEFLKNGFETLISLIPQAYEQGYRYVAMVQQLQVETGMAAGTVSTYAAVMRVMGIDTDSTATILARFGKNLIDSESKFKDLGIATRDVNGQMLSAEQVIENTRRRVAEIGPSFMGSAAAIDLFGRSGYQMLEFLNLSDAQFKALAQDAANAGLVLSQDTLDAAHRFGIEMGRMNDTITGVQTSIFAGLEPSLEHFVDSFATFVQNNLNTIVGFVVSVANFIMGVIGGLFGMDMSAPTLAAGATAGESAPDGSTPTPAPKASAGGGSGTAATNADTVARQVSIKAIEDQITALQALGTAQSAADQQATLQQAITDAQNELTTLQASVVNTYGLSDAERIKAEQKRLADVAKAETKVADTQGKYADYQATQARQAQIELLNVQKQGLQDQLTAQKTAAGGAASVAAGYITTSDTLKSNIAGLGATVGDFSTQARDALAQGKKLSDWIKTTLVPTIQENVLPALKSMWDVLSGIAKAIGDFANSDIAKTFVPNFIKALRLELDMMTAPTKLFVDLLGSLYEVLKWVIGKISDFIGGLGNLMGGSVTSKTGNLLSGFAGHAAGYTTNGPELAWIGEGRESEHVIPHSMLQAALNAAASGGGGRGGGVVMIDKRVLGQVVDEILGARLPAGLARLNR